MRIRSASDVVYTTIAWLPIAAVVLGVAWVLMLGLLEFEAITFGTETLIGNHQTINRMEPIGGASDQQLLMDALNSGDTTQMGQALEQLEQRQQQVAAAG